MLYPGGTECQPYACVLLNLFGISVVARGVADLELFQGIRAWELMGNLHLCLDRVHGVPLFSNVLEDDCLECTNRDVELNADLSKGIPPSEKSYDPLSVDLGCLVYGGFGAEVEFFVVVVDGADTAAEELGNSVRVAIAFPVSPSELEPVVLWWSGHVLSFLFFFLSGGMI